MDMSAVMQSVIASGPEIIVILGACMLLMVGLIAEKRYGRLLVGATLAVIIAAAATTFALAGTPRTAYGGMFVIDDFAIFFKMVLYLATGLTVLMSGRYLEEEAIARTEYYVLLLFALSGMMIMPP